MSAVSKLCIGLFSILCLGCISCTDAPGRPAAGPEVPRPEQVMEFATLYKQNCAGCHGENGKNGAAISLANPIYLAIAGEATVRKITANGVTGKLMPAFERSAGGTLTDQQIDSLVRGILAWSRPDVLHASPPSYAATAKGDPTQGQKTFAEFCASCHGADGRGTKDAPGSIVDPSYLALVSDQSLRSAIIAGQPDQRMPDWRSDTSGKGSRAMTGQEITDVVAWLAAQRTTAPGQPYASQD
jgi:cytochrome c oxidase cbb3-type subunit 3/ubiquinol-cytochrome c reductase cytochrome c subunit